MRRIRLVVEYDGGAYAGWQRQENALAVQQVLEETLGTLTGERVSLTGASRTDAGVHALGQVAAFDTESRIPAEKFAFALNTMLPADIRVRESGRAAADFHPRFMAVGKLYRYRFYRGPHASAIQRGTTAHVIYPLELERMRRELRSLLGRHDFAAFAASGSVAKDTVREIRAASLEEDGPVLEMRVWGTGFLYNMVRIIAGTLVGVGSARIAEGAFARAIASGDRLDLGVTAPAHGLTLMRVDYEQPPLERLLRCE